MGVRQRGGSGGHSVCLETTGCKLCAPDVGYLAIRIPLYMQRPSRACPPKSAGGLGLSRTGLAGPTAPLRPFGSETLVPVSARTGNLWLGCICKRAQCPGHRRRTNNVLMVRYEEWFSSAVWLDGNEHDFPVTLMSPLSLNYLSFGLLFASPLLSSLFSPSRSSSSSLSLFSSTPSDQVNRSLRPAAL